MGELVNLPKDELAEQHDVEGREFAVHIGVGGDDLVWRVQWLDAKNVPGDKCEVVGGHAVEGVDVLFRGNLGVVAYWGGSQIAKLGVVADRYAWRMIRFYYLNVISERILFAVEAADVHPGTVNAFCQHSFDVEVLNWVATVQKGLQEHHDLTMGGVAREVFSPQFNGVHSYFRCGEGQGCFFLWESCSGAFFAYAQFDEMLGGGVTQGFHQVNCPEVQLAGGLQVHGQELFANQGRRLYIGLSKGRACQQGQSGNK